MLLPSLSALAAAAVMFAVAYQRKYGPVRATAPAVPGRATLGVHTIVGQEDGRADVVARTRPLVSEAHGSAFLAFNAGYVSNAAEPVDNMGNTWKLFGERVVYAGYEGKFDVKCYLVMNGKGGPAQRVEIEKPGVPAGELTLPVVEIRNAGRLVDSAYTYAPADKRLASGTVQTEGPAVLVAFWWGDGFGLRHDAVPDNGFEVIERFTELPPGSAVQCVVAVREVESAGSYSVNWTTTPAQGAPLWLFSFDAQKVEGSAASAADSRR